MSVNKVKKPFELNEFLRDRLWYRPDEANIINGAEKRAEYEETVRALMQAVKLDTSMSRDEIIMQIYEALVEKKADQRHVSLILALVDGALAEADGSLDLRDDTKAALKSDQQVYRELKKEDPTDKIAKDELSLIYRQIQDLSKGTIQRVIKVIQEVGVAEVIFRPIAPFEGAYIREEARHRPKGNHATWEAFIQKAMNLFDLNATQIRSAGAHYEKSWTAQGGPRVSGLIANIKRKSRKVVEAEEPKVPQPKPKSKPVPKPKIAEAQVELTPRPDEILDELYNFWPEGSPQIEFVRSFEPEDYTLVEGAVPNQYRRWILAAVGVEPNEERRKLIKTFFAEEIFKVSFATIRALSSFLTGGNRKKLKDERAEEVDRIQEFAEQNPKVPDFPEPILKEASNGAVEDYDNETKEKWRDEWFKFIKERTVPSQRKKMRVICLPGRKCIEAQGYIDMGFKPENIIAVEKDPGVREEFEANARALGLDYRFADLAEILPEMTEPLDVVAYDFHGQISRRTVNDVLSQTLLNKKTLVMLNFLARREDPFIQNELRYFVGRGEAVEKSLTNPENRPTGILDLLHQAEAGGGEMMQDKDQDIAQLRAAAIYSMLCYTLGSNRDDFWRFREYLSHATDNPEVVAAYVDAFDTESGYKPKNVHQPKHLVNIISGNMTVVIDSFLKFLEHYGITVESTGEDNQGHDLLNVGITLKELVALTIFNFSRPKKSARLVKYKSEAKSRPTYISGFMDMERNFEEHNKFKKSAWFFVRVLMDYLKKEKAIQFYFENKFGDTPLRKPLTLIPTDKICYKLESGQVIKIRASHLFKDINKLARGEGGKFLSPNYAPEVDEIK